jgi:pimeloyl-ACP methyl ester carboxylesterase
MFVHLKNEEDMQNLFENIWTDWKIGFTITMMLTVGAALISAWLTPRGPITTMQTLLSMAAALILGLAAGFVTRSRWSLLITPLVFIIAFEVARLGVDGPSVDRVRLNSMYGIIAFVTGRMVHGFFVLLPMIVGTAYGLWFAHRLASRAAAQVGILGGAFTIGATLLLIAAAIFVAQPARTAPIPGPDGEPLPGSIAELTTVQLDGQDQAVMIRGRDTDNPVILYLAGGPGGTDLGAMRADTTLEQDFVVASWDQRGAGKSYAALDPAETLTLQQMIDDTIELTDYLRERFDEDKIFLVGNSWGTTLGVLAVQQSPERYHAYVGTGQMVNLQETDIRFYQETLQWAEQTDNQALAATLRQNGLPPYDRLFAYEASNSHEHDWNPYPELDMSLEMPAILFVPEYSLMDKLNAFPGFLDTFAILYPQLQQIDFRKDALTLDIPVYIILGKHEAEGRAVLARAWFEMLEAPSKELIVFEHSGHRPLFEEPAAFAQVMDQVLAETYPEK